MRAPIVAFIVVAASACVALASCAPAVAIEPPGQLDDDAGNVDAPDALDASSYCEELVDVLCPFYVRCGRMNVADVDACRAAFPSSCEAKFEPLFAPLADAGLVTLSRAGLDACAAYLDDVSCDEHFFELSGPCAAIWQGHVEQGGVCGLDAETFVCAAGTTCTLDLSFCGTCETVLPVGATCRTATGDDVTGVCGPLAECGDDDVCVARPATGEACSDAGPSCVLPSRCAADGVCREPVVVGVGETCDQTHRCGYFAVCDGGVCAPAVGAGGSCVDDGDCEASFCDGSVCVALLDVGAPCDRAAQCGRGRCVDGACGDFAPICVGTP